MSYLAFSCPEGYVFEDSKNATHFAFCYNTTFDVQYDPTKYCVRKFSRYLYTVLYCTDLVPVRDIRKTFPILYYVSAVKCPMIS